MTARSTFEEAREVVLNFAKARKWDQTNSPKDLAISISLEANELLEYFQWRSEPIGNKEDMASELADIFIYAIQFAHQYDVDISSAIETKIEKLESKYPVDLSEVDDVEERSKAWLNAKRNYKKDTTL